MTARLTSPKNLSQFRSLDFRICRFVFGRILALGRILIAVGPLSLERLQILEKDVLVILTQIGAVHVPTIPVAQQRGVEARAKALGLGATRYEPKVIVVVQVVPAIEHF